MNILSALLIGLFSLVFTGFSLDQAVVDSGAFTKDYSIHVQSFELGLFESKSACDVPSKIPVGNMTFEMGENQTGVPLAIININSKLPNKLNKQEPSFQVTLKIPQSDLKEGEIEIRNVLREPLKPGQASASFGYCTNNTFLDRLWSGFSNATGAEVKSGRITITKLSDTVIEGSYSFDAASSAVNKASITESNFRAVKR